MREHGLQAKTRRRHTTTTNSDHDQPIFPNSSKDLKLDGPDQLWVADITYVPVTGGFVYVAIILDAWSRRVVGDAMSRSIDARLTLASLGLAVADRKPPSGCVHHSDRGSQYAAKAYRDELAARDLKGSMGRRGNPYDSAKAESFMKTRKVEAVYPMSFETFEDVTEHFPGSSTTSTTADGSTPSSAISAASSSRINSPGRRSKQRPDLVRRQGPTPHAVPSPPEAARPAHPCASSGLTRGRLCRCDAACLAESMEIAPPSPPTRLSMQSTRLTFAGAAINRRSGDSG